MKHVWSPWRMPYIERDSNQEGCLFCTKLAEEDGHENLILLRFEHTFVMLNRYPYTNGHMMIVPYEHCPTIEDLPAETLSELMQMAAKAAGVLRKVYGAQSFNVGINIGEVAGAGVAEHVHMHVLARWSGDTNFMATVAETRVVPEALETTYRRLKAAW